MISYWDMAALLVTTGAIDPEAFLAAHHEVVATFSKVQPFLTEVRAAIGEPHFCHHLEQVVMSLPDAEAVRDRRRKKITIRRQGQDRGACRRGSP